MEGTFHIENCRGFTRQEGDAVGLIKMPVDRVSEAMAQVLGTSRRTDVYGQLPEGYGFPVWQYHGHPWTLFYLGANLYKLLQYLSEIFQIDCICYDDEEGSMYTWFESGQRVEEYTWGLDYTEEARAAGMIGANDDETFFRPRTTDFGGWLVQASDESTDDCGYFYEFRSLYPHPSEEQIRKPKTLLDTIFTQLDAWLPPGKFWPCPSVDQDYMVSEALDKTAFVRVDYLIIPDRPSILAFDWKQ